VLTALASVVGVWLSARWADACESRLQIPSSVLLVCLGGFLSLTPLVLPLLSRETMLNFLLAPLLFEGARAVDVTRLRSDLGLILGLAIAGTLFTTILIVGLLAGGLGWSLVTVLPFAALIAATDPVAVIATFRSVGLGGRLLTLVESESLLNDAVAACVLSLVPLWLGPTPASGTAIARLLLPEVGFAVLLGLGAGAMLTVLGRLIRSAGITSAVHWLGAVAIAATAQVLGASAVLATVLAGLWVAGRSPAPTSSHRDALVTYGHLANAAVFLLIGWLGMPRALGVGFPVLLAGVAVLVARAATVYPLAALYAGRRTALPAAYQHVLVAGSLRGALALAFVMPLSRWGEGPHELGAADLTVAVVAVSVLTQGLAIRPLLRRTHLLPR
jgi:monovalent cation:H+ antiporter, CPA1 family